MIKINISITCFQIQSAKGPISTSKKLTASDFFLVPTVLFHRNFDLSCLKKMIHDRISQLLIEFNERDFSLSSKETEDISRDFLREYESVSEAVIMF